MNLKIHSVIKDRNLLLSGIIENVVRTAYEGKTGTSFRGDKEGENPTNDSIQYRNLKIKTSSFSLKSKY